MRYESTAFILYRPVKAKGGRIMKRMKKHSWLNPLFIFSLALTGILGVTAGLVNKQVNETPIVEEAKAENIPVERTERVHTIWLNYSTCSSWFNPYVSYKKSDGSWSTRTQMQRVYGQPLAKCTIGTLNMYGIRFFHTNLDLDNNCKTEELDFVYEAPATSGYCVKNYFTLGYQPGDTTQYIPGSWSYNTGLSKSITFNKNNAYASGTMDNQTVWLDNCTINESTFVWDGYRVAYWTKAGTGVGTHYHSGSSYTYDNFFTMDDDESITLYAWWEKITSHTITYDRNKNTGLQEDQTKPIGEDVNAYTPGTEPLTDSGWNPSAFKWFKYWNTDYGDSDLGTRYSAGATITTDDDFTLYYIEDWYDFRYRIDTGSWVNMVHNDAGKGSDIQAQFSPSSAQLLEAGGKLSFEYSNNGGSSWTSIPTNYVTFQGNYDNTNGIKVETLDTIYFKITNGGDYQCWVPGESERRAAVFNDPDSTTGGVQYSMRGNGDTEAVTVTEVYIEKGQYVRRGYNDNYTYETYYEGGTGTAASCFQQYGSNQCVECLITGVYTIYNKQGGGGWWNLYFTRDEEASAKYLAQKFNTIIGDVCTDIVGGSKSLEDLQNVWGSKSTTELYKHFNGQIAATMAYFSTSTETTDPDILACIEKYDYIEHKYGTTALPDFLNRDNGYSASAISNFNPFKLSASDNGSNLSIIIVILASSISLLSITALSVLVVKKRKTKAN